MYAALTTLTVSPGMWVQMAKSTDQLFASIKTMKGFKQAIYFGDDAAGIFNSFVRETSFLILLKPSNNEYSEWTCRWTNDIEYHPGFFLNKKDYSMRYKIIRLVLNSSNFAI